MVAGFPWNRLLPTSTERLLRIAKKHLTKNYLCFGLLEQIETFQQKVASINGWKHQPVYEQTKITRNRPKVEDLPEADALALSEVQKFDIRLYAYAKTHLGAG
jgi:hypothetical protein